MCTLPPDVISFGKPKDVWVILPELTCIVLDFKPVKPSDWFPTMSPYDVLLLGALALGCTKTAEELMFESELCFWNVLSSIIFA